MSYASLVGQFLFLVSKWKFELRLSGFRMPAGEEVFGRNLRNELGKRCSWGIYYK